MSAMFTVHISGGGDYLPAWDMTIGRYPTASEAQRIADALHPDTHPVVISLHHG